MDQMEVVLYTRDKSFRCWRAKRLLRRRGYTFEVVNLVTDGGTEDRAWFDRAISQKQVPFVFVDGRPVGGFDVIHDPRSFGNARSLGAGRRLGKLRVRKEILEYE